MGTGYPTHGAGAPLAGGLVPGRAPGAAAAWTPLGAAREIVVGACEDVDNEGGRRAFARRALPYIVDSPTLTWQPESVPWEGWDIPVRAVRRH